MLRREAAAWLARLNGGDPQASQDFRRWYDADPRHAAAFDRIRGSHEKAGLLRESKLARGRTDLGASGASHRPQLALAATMAAVVLIPAGLLILKSAGAPPFERSQALLLATAVGEIRSVKLADGSTLTIDSKSAVRVSVDGKERRAEVEQGRARFQVENDRLPFTILAGSAEIRTQEAVVDVQLLDQAVRAQVHQGRAIVTPASGPPRSEGRITIGPGEGYEQSASGEVRRYQTFSGDANWTRGMLEFDGTPIADVIATANRYSERQLLVSDPRVAGLKVSGAFRSGDIAGLANALGEMFGLKVEPTSEGNYLLSAGRPASSPKKNGG